MKKMIGYDLEDALDLIGLQRKQGILSMFLPVLGGLFVGAAIGAGAGLAFAPSSGRRLRQGVSERLDQLRDRVKREASNAAVAAQNSANAAAYHHPS